MAEEKKKPKAEYDAKKLFPDDDNNHDTESNKDKKIKFVLDLLTSDTDLEKKTDINKNQVKVLSKALLYAEKFKCPIVEAAAIKVMQLSISKDRKGRKEIQEVGKAYGEQEDQSAFSKLLTGVE
jgi:hypothetical protein